MEMLKTRRKKKKANAVGGLVKEATEVVGRDLIMQTPIVVPFGPPLLCSSSLHRLSPLFSRLFPFHFLAVSCLPLCFLLQTLIAHLNLPDHRIEFAEEFISASQRVFEPLSYCALMERPFWLVYEV